MATSSTRSPCFPSKCLSFFRGLEKNNSRDWFTPRKAVFDAEVRGPMLELVAWLNERFAKFAVEHVAERPDRAVYRVYRDTRFSKDKTPYKTHVGAIFPRKGLSRHGGAGYYVGVSHKGVQVAGGVYGPEPDELAALRQGLVDDLAGFQKLADDKRRRKLTGELQGEQLARVPKGFDADPASPLGQLVRRKQLYYSLELDPQLATTPKLGPEVVKRFEAMSPVMEWMNAVILAAKGDGGEDDVPKRPAPMF